MFARGKVRRAIATSVAMAALFAAMPGAAKTPDRFAHWIDGTSAIEPTTQVQRYDADTFVIRQSIRTNFEAPFLYLLFGRDRAILLDSGAGGLAIRPAVDAVISAWLASNRRTSIPLIVAHSHGHDDHHQGDSEFAARPDTTVIGLKPEDVAAFFKIERWPEEIVTYDLGGRKLSIIATPGHEPAHIMVYDPQTRLLLSGDMLYAGRLYVPTDAFGTFTASSDRLATFAKTHRIAAVLGAHIEMTDTSGKDYAMGASTHPAEHALELPVSAIARLQRAVHRMGAAPVVSNEGDFIIYPRPPKAASPCRCAP